MRNPELDRHHVLSPFRQSRLRFSELAFVETRPRTPGCSVWPGACGCVDHGCVPGGSAAFSQAVPGERLTPRSTFLRPRPAVPASGNNRNPDCAGRTDATARSWWQVSARAAPLDRPVGALNCQHRCLMRQAVIVLRPAHFISDIGQRSAAQVSGRTDRRSAAEAPHALTAHRARPVVRVLNFKEQRATRPNAQ